MSSVKPSVGLVALIALAGVASARAENPVNGLRGAWGARYGSQASTAAAGHSQPAGSDATDWLLRWNSIAIDASGLDHTPVQPGETRTFGEQFGPDRASRAMAIIHTAMFEALNAIEGGYRSYLGLRRERGNVSDRAAIAQAAHDTLVALFPSQRAQFDGALGEDLAAVHEALPRARGVLLGRRAAAAILKRRAADGSQYVEPTLGVDWFTSDAVGHWRQDPIGQQPIALGAHWGEVRPFVLRRGNQFRVPPPPALDSAEYADAYAEVLRIGGDGVATPTDRTPEQTLIGTYWAYDGTPSLCAPPRLYNQITVLIAKQRGTRGIELGRLLALVNVAMADAGIAVWDSKFYYDLWRPVTGIREADAGTGPSGAGDGNPDTDGDPTYTPLGAPASNLAGPNFTPPFPSYPSGHAGFGGALFETLRRFYRTDAIAFTFVSDELNGVTHDHDGATRPLVPRSFTSLSQAEEENGQSRIYLGIHWAFDKTQGIAQGERVADYVFDHVFRERR